MRFVLNGWVPGTHGVSFLCLRCGFVSLTCDLCGEEFLIRHHPDFVSKKSAEKQARWLEKVLADEHEREKKHPDRIELPD